MNRTLDFKRARKNYKPEDITSEPTEQKSATYTLLSMLKILRRPFVQKTMLKVLINFFICTTFRFFTFCPGGIGLQMIVLLAYLTLSR